MLKLSLSKVILCELLGYLKLFELVKSIGVLKGGPKGLRPPPPPPPKKKKNG